MATIKLTDQFGLNVDVVTDPLAGFGKYFKDAVAVVANGFDLSRFSGLDLLNPAITSFQTGLTFDRTIGPVEAQAGLNGTLGVFVPDRDHGALFESDEYGDDLPVAPDERYVSIGLTASAAVAADATVGGVSFGFQPGSSFEIVNYRRFSTKPSAPMLVAAIGDTLQAFSLPASVDDLAALPEAAIVTVNGSGTLSLTTAVNLLAVANPLATLSLPAGAGALEVKAGESVVVNAGFKLSCDYQIRVQKPAPNRIRLGYYKKRSSAETAGVTVSAGVSAGIGSFDLYSTVLGAISSSPEKDRQALRDGGLSAGQAGAIEEAVKAGIARKLELAVCAELSAVQSRQAAFLYEVELDALDAVARDAVERALRGDLSGLAASELQPVPGVTPVRSITSSMRQGGHTLRIDLLGIYNYISISKLTLSGKVVYEPVTGDLVVTDSATAQRIQAASTPFSADPGRLQRVLAESFLITAAYRGSKAAAAAPQLKSAHTFYDFREKTDRQTMRGYLDTGIALDLLAEADEQALLGTLDDFGPTAFYAETRYDDGLTTALFLDGEQPRPLAEYETAGREAVQLLVRAGAPDEYRRRPATDDTLWAQMKSAGQPGFSSLFPGLSQLQVSVIAADYTAIVWWAEAMRTTGEKLAVLRRFVGASPGLSWDDPRFRSLRADLQSHLAAVAADAREEFGRPWGLIAMDRVSGRTAQATVQVSGGRVALLKARPTTAGAASGGSIEAP